MLLHSFIILYNGETTIDISFFDLSNATVAIVCILSLTYLNAALKILTQNNGALTKKRECPLLTAI
jgi:hypothetical protein